MPLVNKLVVWPSTSMCVGATRSWLSDEVHACKRALGVNKRPKIVSSLAYLSYRAHTFTHLT
jgi:hypothetical protein